MNKKILFLLVMLFAVVLVFGGISFSSKSPRVSNSTESESDILIGFSLGSLQEERWQRDREEFLKAAEEMGASVDIAAAQNDPTRQISQIENMILKGVNVLVIAPHDANSLAGIVKKAHDEGIKVIAYDRMINNADVDIYLSFDNELVGAYQAQYVLDAVKDKNEKIKVAYIGGSTTDNNAYLLKNGSFKVLQPKIDNGDIEIVVDEFSDLWSPENAYKNLKEYLVASNGDIDAVVAANDGTAFGSITALKEYSLDGMVPVSGQDAELSAVQRIVQGTQTVTVYKPIPELASAGVRIAISLVNGQNVSINKQINNGKIDVPSVLLSPIPVTKENLNETVIKDGYHTYEEVYNI